MSEEQIKSLTTVTQAITPQDFSQSRQDLLKFVASQLKETKTGTNGDYGVIPYTKGNKKTLLKPGAEKLAKLFGLSIAYEKVSEIEDFDKGFVFYKYKCILTHFVTGRFVGEAVRQSNSKERSYAGEAVFECANKVEAKAQKRALVAAVVQATNASDIFDADVSEFKEEAPNRKVTETEDPRRTRLYSQLYVTAVERGFNDIALHNAAKRIYSIKESLNEMTNEQIEEFKEKLVITFEVVGKGNKPKKFVEEKPQVVTPDPITPELVANHIDKIDAEIIAETVVPEKEEKVEEVQTGGYHCHGKKHEGKDKVITTIDDPWCSDECKNSYFPLLLKKKNRLEELLARGKAAKQAEEAAIQ